MTKAQRVEIAEQVAGAAAIFSPRVWAKTTDGGEELVRVYTTKGYAVIDGDGDVDIDPLGSVPFRAVQEFCADNGIKTYRRFKA